MGLRITKRNHCPLWQKIVFYAAAIVIALLIGAVILISIGVNPLDYYYQMFTMGTVGNRIGYKTFMNYLNDFVPLALTAVALSLAFKMKFWNIGGEGQFIMGAIGAATVAFQVGPYTPMWITLILMCLAAMLLAGLYGLLAAWLKVKFNTNETLMTLMLNYVALYILTFIADTKADWNFFLQEQSTRPVFKDFSEFAAFPAIPTGGKFELNICVILTLIIGTLVYIYLKYTKHGYEIGVIGDSANTARYAGMKVNRIVLRTVFFSAALIGLAAAFKVGTTGVLSTTITNDVGWTGIIVAWLAQLSTPIIFIASALISILGCGCTEANASFGQVSADFADILQGAILFLVLVADFFTRFAISRTKKGGKVNG